MLVTWKSITRCVSACNCTKHEKWKEPICCHHCCHHGAKCQHNKILWFKFIKHGEWFAERLRRRNSRSGKVICGTHHCTQSQKNVLCEWTNVNTNTEKFRMSNTCVTCASNMECFPPSTRAKQHECVVDQKPHSTVIRRLERRQSSPPCQAWLVVLIAQLLQPTRDEEAPWPPVGLEQPPSIAHLACHTVLQLWCPSFPIAAQPPGILPPLPACSKRPAPKQYEEE